MVPRSIYKIVMVVACVLSAHTAHGAFYSTGFDSDTLLAVPPEWTKSEGGINNIQYVDDQYARSPMQSFQFVQTTGIDTVYLNNQVFSSTTAGYFEGYARYNLGNNDGIFIGNAGAADLMILNFGGVGFDDLCTIETPVLNGTPNIATSTVWVYQKIYFDNTTGNVQIEVAGALSNLVQCFDPASVTIGSVGLGGQGSAAFDDVRYVSGAQAPVVQDFETVFNYTTNTRFTDLSITGTSTINMLAGYFLDENEIATNTPALNPSQVKFNISLRPSASQSGQGIDITPFVFGTTSSTSADFSGLADGIYDVFIHFSNLGEPFGGARPFPNSYVYSFFEISGGVLVDSGTPEIYNGVDEETPVYQDCSITQLGNCLVNILTFLFVPSAGALNKFTSLSDELRATVPFGYIFYLYDGLAGISIDGTPAFEMPELPFMADIFTPLRTGMAAILWAFFAFVFYRRLKTIDL